MAQPRQTFAGIDLYPSLAAKAAGLGFSWIQNRPFVDGNKTIGPAWLDTTLMLNGAERVTAIDGAETSVLAVARGEWNREVFTTWVAAHLDRCGSG